MTEEELYAQYLAETGQAPQSPGANVPPSEEELYKQYLAETSAQAESQPGPTKKTTRGEQYSPGESALQGFAESATFGYLPKMQAAVMAGLDPELDYEQAKKLMQSRSEAIQQEDPGAYLAGALPGAVAVPIPGGALKGATTTAKVLRGVGQGAAVAGLSDTGQDMGSYEDLKTRLERAKTGGIIGGAFPAAGAAIQNAAKNLKSYGVLKILGARGKDAEKLLEKNKAGLKRTEEFLDQEGLVGPLTTNSDLVKRADKITKESGAKIGDIYDKAQGEAFDLLNNTPVTADPKKQKLVDNAMNTRLEPNKLADEFMAKASEELTGTANGDQILSALNSQLENLRKVPPQKGLKGIVKFRETLDDALKKSYEKPAADLGEKQEAMMALRRYMKDRTNEHLQALDNLVGSNSTKELLKLNDRYSNAATVRRITGKSEVAQMRNNLLGLPELIVGGATGGAEFARTGDPSAALKGVAAGAAYKLGRNYGPALSIKTGQALQLAPNIPARAFITPWMNMTKEQK